MENKTEYSNVVKNIIDKTLENYKSFTTRQELEEVPIDMLRSLYIDKLEQVSLLKKKLLRNKHEIEMLLGNKEHYEMNSEQEIKYESKLEYINELLLSLEDK